MWQSRHGGKVAYLVCGLVLEHLLRLVASGCAGLGAAALLLTAALTGAAHDGWCEAERGGGGGEERGLVLAPARSWCESAECRDYLQRPSVCQLELGRADSMT